MNEPSDQIKLEDTINWERDLMIELLTQILIDGQVRRCISQSDGAQQNMASFPVRYASMGGQQISNTAV